MKSDKTCNYYYIDTALYQNAIIRGVCKFDKNADHNWEKAINRDTEAIANELKNRRQNPQTIQTKGILHD